jgi:uncharacterized membrane protein
MKNFLQGAWLGHPLHSFLVHLPIALWPAALIFDLMAQLWPDDSMWALLSYYAIGLGLVSAALAIPTGLADWLDIQRENPVWQIGQYHLILNSIATGLWTVNFTLRTLAWTESAPVPLLPLGLSFLGTAVLMVGGYLGGRMVYGYGVGVARASKGKRRRLAQAAGANLPPE